MQHSRSKIVFLPGWGVDVNIWQPIAKLFTTAEFLNLPYYDRCDEETILTWLKHHILKDSIIIAWSISALFIIRFISEFPQHVKKVVLVASTPRFLATNTWQGITVKMRRYFLETIFPEEIVDFDYFNKISLFPNVTQNRVKLLEACNMQRTESKHLIRYLDLLFTLDYRDYYKNITTPTLHILGNSDAIVKACPQQLQMLNGSIYIRSIIDAGHTPFLSHPDEFGQIVLSFIGEGC